MIDFCENSSICFHSCMFCMFSIHFEIHIDDTQIYIAHHVIEGEHYSLIGRHSTNAITNSRINFLPYHLPVSCNTQQSSNPMPQKVSLHEEFNIKNLNIILLVFNRCRFQPKATKDFMLKVRIFIVQSSHDLSMNCEKVHKMSSR